MSLQIKAALIALGITALVASLLAALSMIILNDPNIIISWKKGCKQDTDCTELPVPVCATCLECHETLGQCVYSLNPIKECPCVQGEMKPCEIGLIPGKQTCMAVTGSTVSTEWGTCELFPPPPPTELRTRPPP